MDGDCSESPLLQGRDFSKTDVVSMSGIMAAPAHTIVP